MRPTNSRIFGPGTDPISLCNMHHLLVVALVLGTTLFKKAPSLLI